MCKVTEVEGTHCSHCMLQYQESEISNDDTRTLRTTVPVGTPKSIKYSEALESFDLPTTLLAPIFPTGAIIDTPTDRIHRIDDAHRHPTTDCECKITVIEGTHCKSTVPSRTPISIQYGSEAVESFDLPTILFAPIFPTGVSIATPTDRIHRSVQIETKSTFSLSNLRT